MMDFFQPQAKAAARAHTMPPAPEPPLEPPQGPEGHAEQAATPSANAAGTLMLGGEMPVARLGFGALHTVGAGGWGDPEDEGQVRELLELVPELGINLIDTADAYGPYISEALIRRVLHPYDTVIVATKGGQVRPKPNAWSPMGRPEYLKHAAQSSRLRLDVDTIDLWQLHRIDRRVPRDEQFAAIAELRNEGVIRHVGLSECQIDDIQAAQRFFPVASVQSRYSLVDRRNEAVLDYCAEQGIAFMPWKPLELGPLAEAGGAAEAVAWELSEGAGASENTGAAVTPQQVALAWLLRRSPVTLPIPGTSSPAHLRENVAAASLHLSQEQFERLSHAGRREWERDLVEDGELL